MLVKLKAECDFDGVKRTLYFNPLHIVAVEEFDENECLVRTDSNTEYVADGRVDVIAAKIGDALEEM